MWKFSEVASIEYQSGYSYRITFDDGISGVVDFSEDLNRGPVYAALQNLEFFRAARVDGGAIAWPNGADVAPETLYRKCQQETA